MAAGVKQQPIVPRPPDATPVEEVKLRISAAKVIRASGKGRLPEEIIFDILSHTAEGLSWQKIQKRVLRKHSRMLAMSTIKKYQERHAPRIREMTAEWDKEAISAGLARKAVRLRKLQDVADAIEETILPNGEASDLIFANAQNMKAMTSEYRELLKQIGVEVGDISEGASGDIAFIGMSNEELMKQASNILSKNKDLAVIISEKAGVRPILPESLRRSEEEDADQEDSEETSDD